LIRNTYLTIEKTQKEEEAALRKELEKKHNSEQIDFKQNMATQQAKLRYQCLEDAQLAECDLPDEERALE